MLTEIQIFSLVFTVTTAWSQTSSCLLASYETRIVQQETSRIFATWAYINSSYCPAKNITRLRTKYYF